MEINTERFTDRYKDRENRRQKQWEREERERSIGRQYEGVI